MIRKGTLIFAAAAALAATGLSAAPAGAAMPSSTTRFATDAYPGFDREENIISSKKKEPRWFSWINGPAKTNATEQLAYAEACESEQSWRAARRAYDALVREWPSSPEAPVAQLKLADLYLGHYLEYEEAFTEYKYLLDYYSSQCDYDAMARRLYEVARLMEREGKTLIFFRFANTVDVHRAFEAVVLRAPGADFAPAAMLTVASLREDEGEFERAVQVYENLRNLHPLSAEAPVALHREGAARMKMLHEHEYNRGRCQDTIAFLRMALASNPSDETKDDFSKWLDEAVAKLEDEAFAAAKFYDSRTRTRRSAVNAYERFLRDYPASRHVDEARARLKELGATSADAGEAGK